MPKTFWGKVKNYAYHYKVIIIVSVFLIGLISFGVYDYVTKVRPDIEVVVYTNHRILDVQMESFKEILTPYCTDINEDGVVEVTPINCSVEKGSESTQADYLSSTKFSTLIAGDPQAILFILDKESYQHLLSLTEGETFIEGEPLMLNKEIYQKVKEKSGFDLPEGLMLCYRRIAGTLIEKDKSGEKVYEAAKVVLENMKAEYPPEEFLAEE